MKKALHTPGLIRMITQVCGSDPRRGIEIGVEMARTSTHLLSAFPNLVLFGIDPWQILYGNSDRLTQWADRHKGNPKCSRHVYRSQDEHDRIRKRALRELRRFGRRSKIMRQTSEEARPRFGDEQVDFVFIDGDHSNCTRDIELYWPLVRSGGLLAGHDYNSKLSVHGVWDVNTAVDSHALSTGLKTQHETNNLWGFQKP